MNLKNLKFDLPAGRWREFTRHGNENQVCVRLNHISPLVNIDSKKFQDRIISETEKEIVYHRGITQAGGSPLKDFHQQMKDAIANGMMPAQYNMAWLNKYWKKMTEAHGSADNDFETDFTVLKLQDEQTAKQHFENLALMPTKGFDVPIPGMSLMPGLPKNVTMIELLQSDFLKNHLKNYASPEQIAKMQTEIATAQKQMSKELRRDQAKSGIKYQFGKYLGCPAVVVKSNAKEKGTVSYQALRVKSFVITGLLLLAAKDLPAGNTLCDSLTKINPIPIITREKIEGKIFVTKEYIPAESVYAVEGYLYREEAEEIIKSTIKKLL